MLARDMTGYKNLIALVTKANLEGYYYKPRMDRELLEQHSAGITVLSGCPSAEFHRRIQEGDREGAIDVARYYREVFDGHYFLEVQDHGDPKFTPLNPAHRRYRPRELGIPVVATNDSHYTLPEEAEAHDVLLCIGTNATVDQQDRFKIDGARLLREERSRRCSRSSRRHPGVRSSNTQLVAERATSSSSSTASSCRNRRCRPAARRDEYLARALLRRPAPALTPTSRRARSERLAYELDVVKQTGFTDYIYVVKEIADVRAQGADIRMGVRGSAAASLILYCLGVTDIDPVANRPRLRALPQHRTPRDARRRLRLRRRPPRRGDPLRLRTYGGDRVAQIITFGTLGAKAAIRDVGRALGMTYADVDRVARLVPNALHMTLDRRARTDRPS